jgi:hypothetical protein
MSSKVDIRFGNLFPWGFHVVAGLAAIVALGLIASKPFPSLAILVMSMGVLTAREGTEIDPAAKKYREYTAFFFVKSGEWLPYGSMEKVFINRNRVKQRVYTARTNHSAEFTYDEFSAFLKFDDGEKVQLMKHRSKEALMRRVAEVAKQLVVTVVDNTSKD